MKIDLQQLHEEPVVYDVDLSPEYLADGAEEPLRFDPGKGRVTFRMLGKEILAEGALDTRIRTTCGRCLSDLDRPIHADVHLYYLPETGLSESKIAEIEPEEPDYGVYSGTHIEPDDDLRELLLVEVPGIILCNDDCRGLCAGCGANLNDGACTCEDKEEEPRPGKGGAWKDQLRSIDLDADK